MCDCFRDHRTIEIEQQPTPRGPPIRSYRFVRSPSIKSPNPPSTTFIRPSSPDVQPVKYTSHPPEGDDARAGNSQPFHPLPPVIHQYPPPQQHNHYPIFGTLEHPRHNHQLVWPNNDKATFIIDDGPERAVARVPKRDSRGRRVIVRVNRSQPDHRSLPHTSRARSSEGRYCSSYYYGSSDGSRPGRDWEDGDSWAEGGSGTVKSGEWSDGGDSWDGNPRGFRTRRIESGRRDGRRGYYLN